MSGARAIAFYLPQFHPVPENDEWWGPGFTEWTNVAGARRLFPGHYQPHLPGHLGFYDLRLPETRDAQADLARAHGVEAFCYWHYWFGGGRRMLARPFEEVLASGRPDFPFCLAWANQSWTGVWHGAPDRVLVEQAYPGDDDDRRHFEAVLPAFADPRYLTVGGKPLFYVYAPHDLPDARRFTDRWRKLAAGAGLPGLHLVAEAPGGFDAVAAGFDGWVEIPWARLVGGRPLAAKLAERAFRLPRLVPYGAVTGALVPDGPWPEGRHPCVVPNWDNTPRTGRRGIVVTGATPAAFGEQVRRAVAKVAGRPPDERLLFVKSWNEWAEGNHLEPDRRHGLGFLEALRAGLDATGGRP